MWPTKKICVHCKRKPVNRPHGLCWGCFNRAGVKEIYRRDCPLANRGRGLRIVGHASSDLPTVLTDAEPGTEAKIAILEARAEQGISLFHPDEPELRPGSKGASVLKARLRDFPLAIARDLT